MFNTPTRDTLEHRCRNTGASLINFFIRAMKLGPSFFNKADPHIGNVAVGKRRLAISAWQKVVKDNRSANAVNIQINQVATCCIDLLCVKKLKYLERVFSH